MSNPDLTWLPEWIDERGGYGSEDGPLRHEAAAKRDPRTLGAWADLAAEAMRRGAEQREREIVEWLRSPSVHGRTYRALADEIERRGKEGA